jgi:biotin transport system substrate-specific component
VTYADVFKPTEKFHGWIYDVAVIGLGSLLIAISAQVAVQLPFSPVPITGQTLAVLLTGMLLGRWRGVLSVLAYLAEGVAGSPFFAGGMAGPAHMLGPAGGYLIGFVMAAYVTGWLAERGWHRRLWSTLLAMLLGNVAIYAFGLVWLARFVDPESLLRLGCLPFLLGDLLKVIAATTLLPTGSKLLGPKVRWRLLQPKNH